MNLVAAFAAACGVLALPGSALAGAVVAHSQDFGDWELRVVQDEWGDNRIVKLMAPDGISISINGDFGFVIQSYPFDGLRDYWPYCEVTSLAYRVDGGAVVKTGMGGDAATGGSCAVIRMPGYMLADMSSGSLLELRAGHSGAKVAVSLNGFASAWAEAQKWTKVPPRVDTWMRPR
ncbi:hypothetical protein LO767_00105 [Halopseudomonas aestusnigri]|uniref:hypothetical protein n=1 Tax=Halopseudomonas aestusnigri TaxID=857252 RepID=UPI001E3F7843|nr:hypothetical protein [Halopseudomonas aestusnigri]UGV30964.1 hypothetical protein LO767_00105 [Halopseudomonas aestusnigri]